MIAIETRFLGPTDTKGSRIVAETCNEHRLVIPSDHSLSREGQHRKAAQMLADRQGWKGRLICAGTKRGFVFVFEDKT